MEDKMSLILALFSVIPIIILVLGIWKEYVQYRSEKEASATKSATIVAKTTEYEKVQNATSELESDFQPNKGEHHPEEVYLKRAKLIRKETSWYNLVNSL